MEKEEKEKLNIKIADAILNELFDQSQQNHFHMYDASDFGNIIGQAVGDILCGKQIEGFSIEDFKRGFDHGISIKDGSHPK